ncbi:PAS domain-containing hybrid sensor histidine kinase/response regulator [Parasedimentitalea psychrophila]|uniref:histidine kinase n=1 Tax=Parasedimentitalea psychrophila TaxID=2997337 RepID=A0A9Y2L060_9RHOB|nr:PAS domain-containing hybrid sensor histidine kinase/response regulator [Parasedimentitalea psychrophila]WIY24952.1 ATP-binding protein [Parasedimentitalea psychrophila]
MNSKRATARTRLVLTLTIAFLVGLGTLSLGLGRLVLDELDTVGGKASERLTWNLAQVQFSHIKMTEIAYRAKEGENLNVFRLEFAKYYNRVATLHDYPMFDEVRADGIVAEKFIRIQNRLDYFAPIVAGPDRDLVKSLPELIIKFQQNDSDIRDLIRYGLQMETLLGAESKQRVSLTIRRLGRVLLTLVAALAMTAIMIQRLFHHSQGLIAENRATAERLRVIVDSSLEAIVSVDVSGRILSFNSAAEKTFGYLCKDVVGRRLMDVIIPEHLHQFSEDNTASFLKTGDGELINKGRTRVEAKRKSGEIFPIELNVTASQDGDDLVFVCFIRDITSRIEGEKALRCARDDAQAGERAKDKLLTVLSHEIRTPLNGIMGSIELLETADTRSQEQQYLRAMRQSGELLLHHVDEVLEMSRLESAAELERSEPFDLQEMLAGLIDGLHPTAQSGGNLIRLRCRLPEDAHCIGNSKSIRKVLQRLIGNALKFTERGEVTIEVERLAHSDAVEFRVCDTGEGIAADDLERIFDDFVTLDASYSRQQEGTGLGLSITRLIVEQMGGEIGVESEPGEGSMFWFTLSLPLVSSRQNQHPKMSIDDVAARRILVVEDNDINRMLLEEMLLRQGHRVRCATGGAEGVEAVQHERYDLILMDISMPGLDGIEALGQIRSRKLAEGVEIIALTAHGAGDDQRRILDAGFTEILIKPVTLAKLALAIDRYTGQKTPIKMNHEGSDIQQFIEALGNEKAQGYLNALCRDVAQFRQDLGASEQVSQSHQREAHRLAGSAAVLGLTALRTCLQEIEAAAAGSVPPSDALADAWGEAGVILGPYLVSSPVNAGISQAFFPPGSSA